MNKKYIIIFKSFLIILIWFLLNIFLNIYNKWMFSEKYELRFPIIITAMDTVANGIGTGLLINALNIGRKSPSIYKKNLICFIQISFYFCLNIALNNYSLLFISVSTNQIIKAFLPFIMIIVEYFKERKNISKKIFLSVFIIVIGVIIAVWHDPQFHLIGIMMAFISVFFVGIWTVASSYLMKSGQFDGIKILYYTSPISFVILSYASAIDEYCLFRFSMQTNTSTKSIILLTQALQALFYNIIHYMMIQHTSPLTSAILGNVKIIAIICVGFWFFNLPIIPNHIIGIILTIIGTVSYSFFKYIENKNQQYTTNKNNKTIEKIIINTED